MVLLLRFVCGGAIVAVLPTVAGRFGPRAAAVLMCVPALTLIGFVALIKTNEGMGPVARQAIVGIVPTFVFLATLTLLARHVRSSYWLLVAGVTMWALTAGIAVTLKRV